MVDCASECGGKLAGLSFIRHEQIYQSDVLSEDPGRSRFGFAPGFHRFDEFATGYSLAGCTPAEPASASPIVFHLRAEARYLSTVSRRRIAGLQGSAETEYQHQVGPI
jgi:hypothetical protein